MDVKELILKNRSYRRFYEDVSIPEDELTEYVDNARLSATGGNVQSLKFIISGKPETNAIIFPTLAWAGYLKDWPGPSEGERPSAYIIILNDKNISERYWCNQGIAAQSILLTAVEKGYGGCMIAAVQREKLAKALNLPGNLEILLVLALGKPKETVVIEKMGPDGNYKYWRDENQVHHVPKRELKDIILKL
ncbi:MAG: nitroreductase family protein [Bacteroidota bacterium]|nr:nitroreductase family protein [Bacteroidota bacterium]